MRKEKGQALIEFVLILPVFLLILFVVIDFGRLFYEKVELENRFEESIEVLKKHKNYEEAFRVLNEGQMNEATLEVNDEDSYMKIKTTLHLSFLTPGLDQILGENHIKIERVIPYEEG